MRNIGSICTILLFILTLYYMVQEEPKPQQEDSTILVNQPPEKGREVHHFDWKENKYIYTDEVEPEPEIPPLQHELEFTPDHAVWGIDEKDEFIEKYSNEPRYIRKDGKTYRVTELPNGTIQLREWR